MSNQGTPVRTVGAEFDFLEPFIHPELAREIHGKIILAASTTTVSYPKGQVVCQKNDGSNEFAKIGTSGYAGPARIVKYPFTINDAGRWQHGSTFVVGRTTHDGSIPLYYEGFFQTSELTGLGSDANALHVGDIISGTRTSGIIKLRPKLAVA